jgi:hypothetical protein
MVIYVLRSTTSLRLIFESTFQLLSFYPKSKPSNLLGILRTIMKSHAIPPKCHYLLQLSGLPWRFFWGVSKNTKNSRKLEKKIIEKTKLWKKNQLKFWKNRPVWFYKPKTKKTRKNRATTGLNRFLSKKIELKPAGLNWFRFLKKRSVWLFFFL